MFQLDKIFRYFLSMPYTSLCSYFPLFVKLNYSNFFPYQMTPIYYDTIQMSFPQCRHPKLSQVEIGLTSFPSFAGTYWSWFSTYNYRSHRIIMLHLEIVLGNHMVQHPHAMEPEQESRSFNICLALRLFMYVFYFFHLTCHWGQR